VPGRLCEKHRPNSSPTIGKRDWIGLIFAQRVNVYLGLYFQNTQAVQIMWQLFSNVKITYV
jgi:hypothetical protein